MITSESRALNERKAVLWVVRAVSYLVYFYLIVVEIILFIGFFLLLFGANPDSGFSQWAYRNLDQVMAPFRGIFTPIELGTTASGVRGDLRHLDRVRHDHLRHRRPRVQCASSVGCRGGSRRSTPPRRISRTRPRLLGRRPRPSSGAKRLRPHRLPRPRVHRQPSLRSRSRPRLRRLRRRPPLPRRPVRCHPASTR